MRGAEFGVVPGIFQTAEYARAVLTRYVELRGTPKDVQPAVSARMRRQEALFEPGREFHALVWEGALRMLICSPEVLVGQLDRLTGPLGMDTVSLGIIPFEAPLIARARSALDLAWTIPGNSAGCGSNPEQLRSVAATHISPVLFMADSVVSSPLPPAGAADLVRPLSPEQDFRLRVARNGLDRAHELELVQIACGCRCHIKGAAT